MVFQGTAVTGLSILNLEFRNTGSKVMHAPHATIRIGEEIRILAASLNYALPPVDPTDAPVIENNVLHISLPALHPYAQDKDVHSVTIFADNPIVNIAVDGRGELDGGLAWSVKFKPISAESERRFRIARELNRLVLPYLVLALLYLAVIHPPSNVIRVDSVVLQRWLSDLGLWILAAFFGLWWGWIGFLLIKGHYAYVPLPFRGTELRFYIKQEKLSHRGSDGSPTARRR